MEKKENTTDGTNRKQKHHRFKPIMSLITLNMNDVNIVLKHQARC